MPEEPGRTYQRFVVDGATVDFQPEGALFRRGSKGHTGHVLNFSLGGVQILCSDQEELAPDDKLTLNIHLRNRHNWMKIGADVRWCRKVPGRPFKRAGMRFLDPNVEQIRLLRDLVREYAPIQESELKGQTGRLVETYRLPPLEGGAGQPARDVEAALGAERVRFGVEKKQVQRPVALLELIGLLEKFEVTDELVLAVLEVIQQGVSVEELFGVEEKPEEVGPRRRRVVEEKPKEEARPMPVYRLDAKNQLHFNDDGVPVSPPVDHLFYSRMKDEVCFACEIQDDRMVQENGPSFRPGDVVIFSKTAKVENGSFVFVKTKEGDEFAQVLFGRDEYVRLRPLNGNYPEKMVRRFDLKLVFRLIGRLQLMG